jgi:AAA15 family ATPase/GTPase
MIVSFSVSNFRSFLAEETISLVASKRLSGSHDEHTVPIPDSNESVLRTAVLYGANGAGKSNLFKAIRYMRSVAVGPRAKNTGTGRERFQLAGSKDDLSNFDLQFIAAGRLYRYGFKADDERIAEEWLYHVTGNRQTPLYERSTDVSGRVSIDAKGLRSAGEKLSALATVGGPQNQSFLATISATLAASDVGEELGHILGWFVRGLTLVGPDEVLGPLALAVDQDSDFRSFASAFLKSSSTGVDQLVATRKEISQDEFAMLLPSHLIPFLRAGTITERPEMEVIRLADGKEIFIDHKGDSVYHITVQATHEKEPGKEVRLELTEESDGTRRLLDLIPALHPTAFSGLVHVIDEIDRSLHPILVKEFLEFFLKSGQGEPRQVIVTTHESNLLDQDLLRRDEIWFAEKDSTGATRLYSLLDFKVRNDLEIRKHYLQGRFGAIPFLGNLESLLTTPDRHE